MHKQDKELHQLIAAVCQYRDGSPENRKAMSRLLSVLQGLPEFRKYSRLGCPEYLLDAMNQTWMWLSQNIRSFRPSTSDIKSDLVRWINAHLYWRTKDLVSRTSQDWYYLDRIIDGNDDIEETSWLSQLSEQGLLLGKSYHSYIPNGIEAYIEQFERESIQRIAQAFVVYVKEDPFRRLHDCYPRNYPQCNCHLLSQRLLFCKPPDKFTALSREFNINYQTLVSHWKRKALPLLRAIALELGYRNK